MVKRFHKVIAFDLDGTLVDSAPDITEALNYVLLKNNLYEVKLENVKKLIGSGAKALIKDSFEKQGIKTYNISNLTTTFLKKYNECFKKNTSLFPYAEKMLKDLIKKDFKIVLVSNKPEYYSKELLKFFNISKYFSFISGGDTYTYRKPDPRHITSTVNDAGIKNYTCLFVGDSKFDLECSNKAKIPCILLTHGYSAINVKTLGAYKVVDNLIDAKFEIENFFSLP